VRTIRRAYGSGGPVNDAKPEPNVHRGQVLPQLGGGEFLEAKKARIDEAKLKGPALDRAADPNRLGDYLQERGS
jgi:hypothetical protein